MFPNLHKKSNLYV